ncbi:hypothetical protein CF326_g5188 [Tilletia indica]|nr:hypothetical protein CF326_g5188 [Tilletia indica]
MSSSQPPTEADHTRHFNYYLPRFPHGQTMHSPASQSQGQDYQLYGHPHSQEQHAHLSSRTSVPSPGPNRIGGPFQASTHQVQARPNPSRPGSPIVHPDQQHGQLPKGPTTGSTHPGDQNRPMNPPQSPVTPGVPNAARRSAPVPTDKTLVKRYLSEPEIQAQLAAMVRQWTEASIASVVDKMTNLVRTRIDLGMERYSVAVQAFKAQVLRITKVDDAQRSDDGNIYLRVNHAELTAWFTALNVLRRELNTRIDQLNVEIEDLKKRQSASASVPAFTFVAGAAAKVKSETKNHKWTKLQAGFKTLVCVQAGIPSGRGNSDAGTKIYELKYPSSPSEITYHPVAYVPIGAEAPAPESSGAEGGPRFRQLRFRLDLNWDDVPNKELVLLLLAVLMRDRAKYDIPPDMTAEELMDVALKRTWIYWKDRFRQLNSGVPADEVRQGWNQSNVDARRAKRISAKGARRYQTHLAMVKDQPHSGAFDTSQKIAYSDQYQSSEETEYEQDDSGPVELKQHCRKDPDFRSLQLKRHLRSLDDKSPNPKIRLIDSDETMKTGSTPPAGSFNWMVRPDYLQEHPEISAQLLPNLGPFQGAYSVVPSAETVGSWPQIEEPTPSSFATGGTSSTMQQLFGSGLDAMPGMAIGGSSDARSGLDFLMGE